MKGSLLLPIPSGPCTCTIPVRASSGTDVLISVSDTTVKPASTVWNRTEVMPVKRDPVIVTGVPSGPAFGDTAVISGNGPNVFCQ